MIPEKKELLPFVNKRKEAAEQFNVTERTIVNWMKKYKIYKPKKNYGCNKLNLKKAKEIRNLYQNGKKVKDLSEKYGVTIATISRIINNIFYKENIDNDTAQINVIYNTDK